MSDVVLKNGCVDGSQFRGGALLVEGQLNIYSVTFTNNRANIFGGAIITEQVFKVNGIGQLLITAIQANDLPMVQTLTFIFAVLIVVFNLIADVLYGILDPRIRYD